MRFVTARPKLVAPAAALLCGAAWLFLTAAFLGRVQTNVLTLTVLLAYTVTARTVLRIRTENSSSDVEAPPGTNVSPAPKYMNGETA